MSKVIGIVLDLSLRHLGGKRIIDQVKEEIINYLLRLEDDDGFYLYHHKLTEVLYKRGEQVAVVGNYDSSDFNVSFALEQTMYVVAAADEEEKIVHLITDRLMDCECLGWVKLLNEKLGFGCIFMVTGIGNYYKRSEEIKHDEVLCLS